MKQLNRKNFSGKVRPVKIMQFGEGNFLRAFVDWIIQKMNDDGVIDANVVVVQPMPFGRIAELEQQDGLYTVCLEGVDGGKKVQSRQIVDVLGDFVNPYEQYDKFLSYAHSPELQVVVSNTTEAGISLDETDVDFSVCPKSYPGKLLAFLQERYRFFNGDEKCGLAIIPCELIDHNGDELKKVLNQLAEIKGASQDFIHWLNNANHFTSTLVDRIVPGYPKDSADAICAQTGYFDVNIVKGEFFHLWVLQKEPFVMDVFPAHKVGLNVIYADDIVPYKQRKVKVLNGSHTAMVPIAYLCGLNTVGEAMADADVFAFIKGLASEIKPTIDLPQEEVQSFVDSVYERFQNPFIKHMLMSIALNSTTKFVTRLLPTYNDFVTKFGKAPQHVLFALSALAVFYKGVRGEEKIQLQDSPENLAFWADVWCADTKTVATRLLSAENVWQQNLCTEQNVQFVAKCLEDITCNGMRRALQNFLSK